MTLERKLSKMMAKLLGYDTHQFTAQIPETLLLLVFGYHSTHPGSDTW